MEKIDFGHDIWAVSTRDGQEHPGDGDRVQVAAEIRLPCERGELAREMSFGERAPKMCGHALTSEWGTYECDSGGPHRVSAEFRFAAPTWAEAEAAAKAWARAEIAPLLAAIDARAAALAAADAIARPAEDR